MNIRTVRVLVAATVVPLSATVLSTSPATAGVSRTSGELTVYSAIEQGATARVQSVETGSGRTITTLSVTGLAPNTTYGSHAHVNPCDKTDGKKAGPHFTYKVDPTKSLMDPVNANPANEIWLDFTTDAAGKGHAKSDVAWQFSPDPVDRAKSVVIHATATNTGPTNSGTAGARLACLTVPF